MKKIIIILLLIIPFTVSADECDKEKHKEYLNLSESITYDNNYSKSTSSFSITIYNVFDGMYAKYNEKVYKPLKDNTVVINKIACGTKMSIDIYGNDGCGALKRIIINEPYYNKYYQSNLCDGYEDKLLMCSSQFTSTEVTKSLLEKAIYNYNHSISQVTSRDKEVNDDTFFTKFLKFMTDWGLKILLGVISTILSISLFGEKYRKVKHGI